MKEVLFSGTPTAAEIIRHSIDPAWGPAGVSAVEALAAHLEALERDRALGDAAADEAQERYECSLIEEARAMVVGESRAIPTLEHLRVLLAALDWARHRYAQGQEPSSERVAVPF